MLRLKGPQLKVIIETILRSYVGLNALQQLDFALKSNLDRTVLDHVTVQAPLRIQVWELVVAANGQGWLASLLGAIKTDRPDDDALRDLVSSLMSTAPATQVLAFADDSLSGGQLATLQRMLPGGAILAFDTLQRRIRSVCRIDYADQSPPGEGTGFLVGSDLVLTAGHVVKRVIDAPQASEQLRFRFDLLKRNDAVDGKGRVARASKHQPVVRSLPPGGVEQGGTGEPTAQQLDYALIRLDECVGHDQMGDDKRGYMVLSANSIAAQSALMVLQHPLRAELQFAVGSALGPNETGSRLRHTASTQAGSSGSPVLDSALAAVALHNGGRRNDGSTQDFNTAVPLSLIVEDLRNAGINL
jgi:hypothetical protein